MALHAVKVNPKKFYRDQIPVYLVLIPVALFMGAPLVYIVSQAFKPLSELFQYPPRFFAENPTLDNFTDLANTAALSRIPLSRYIFNSIIVAAATVFLSLLICTTAGFALSKIRFRFSSALFELNNTALMFVAVAVQIPRYLVISGLGLVDTYFAHVLPLLAMPVCLFLIKQFIDQLPNELLEATQLDGGGAFTVYWKVVLPLIKPAIATGAILIFQSVWNNMESSNLFINKEGMRTLTFYFNTLTDANNIQGRGQAAAASLLLFLPNLILFIVMQSNVMNTMAYSGMKG